VICSLDLTLDAAEGALIRVLGLAERRGYPPVGVDATTLGDTLRLTLTVRANRPIDLLIRQLERLFDVRDVSLAAPALREVAS
jgi:acetolactate synthase II small subunit